MLCSFLQVRAGSRALYRPLSASVLSRPEIKTEVRKMQPLQLLYITAWTFLTFPLTFKILCVKCQLLELL